MRRIGLLSDTHGYMDDRILSYLGECDEIWHAGDIGTMETAQKLSVIKPLRAVSGNIDGTDLRKEFPLRQRFFCEEVDVLIIHIGGYPGHYAPEARKEINLFTPKLFISGHSQTVQIPQTDTVVCFMGGSNVRLIAQKAITEGRNPKMPVMLVFMMKRISYCILIPGRREYRDFIRSGR